MQRTYNDLGMLNAHLQKNAGVNFTVNYSIRDGCNVSSIAFFLCSFLCEGKAIMNLRFNSKLVALFRFHIMLLGHGVSFLKCLGGLTLIFSETESIQEVLKQF